MSFTNYSTVYYTIDLEKDAPQIREDSNFLEHLKVFVEDKLSTLYASDSNRQYILKDTSTQVISKVNQLINTGNNSEKIDATYSIAYRLLDREKDTQERISHLESAVQRGGLIISHFEKNGEDYICIVKVHYLEYYSEDTFEEERGLPKKNVVLKTCINKLEGNQLSNDFLLSDSTKIKGAPTAKFWWDEFLELKSMKSDKENTKLAFNKVERLLKKDFYETNREDFWYLKNNLVSYFRTNEQFNFNEAIETTLGQFDLKILEGKTQEEKSNFKARLKRKIEAVAVDNNGNRLFDTQFDINSTEVKARTKTVIKLMENVELNIKGQVQDFANTIVPSLEGSGSNQRKYLKIYTNEGYDEFKN